MHADQREADTLDVDVVHLGVDEDVVDVQIHVDVSEGRVRGNSRACSQHGRQRLPGGHIGHALSSGGTLSDTSGSLLLHSELQVQITGGDEEDVGRGLQINGDEALSVGDRHGGDGKAAILAEPEDHDRFCCSQLFHVWVKSEDCEREWVVPISNYAKDRE